MIAIASGAPAQATVIIVGYRGDPWLPKCISSLWNGAGCGIEGVVVDNAQNRCLEGLRGEYPRLKVLKTPRSMGFAEANNFAIAALAPRTPYLVLLNQDPISGPEWIRRCIACLEADRALAVVSPLLRTYDGSDWDPAFRECAAGVLDARAGPRREATDSAIRRVERVTAAAAVVRTDVVGRLGLFDPIFGSYYEDYDFCRRLKSHGYRIGICPGAEVRHYSGSASCDVAARQRRMRLIIRNRMIHDIRGSAGTRFLRLLYHLQIQFPRNLLRSLLSRPSSQPPWVVFGAYWSTLGIADRLISRRVDELRWRRYLERIGWAKTVLERRRSVGAN